MQHENIANDLAVFTGVVKKETDATLAVLDADFYAPALELIGAVREAGGRLHVTGIGKPSYVAGYVASLLSSVGTPCYFLHGTEAVHGSSGQLVMGDVVICISNSGETAELKATAAAIRANGGSIIAVTGNAGSWLARYADVHLLAHVDNEGGPLNRAPRASVLAEMAVLQGLSVAIQSAWPVTPQQYVQRHPGGALGKLKENEQ